MSPSSYEGLVFDGVDLNAATGGWSLEAAGGTAFTLTPPSKRIQRLSSADADADILAEAATHDLRIGTARVRWEGGGGMDGALAAIRDIVARLQRCEERELGSALVWTPANSTRTGTLRVQSGEITDLPIEQDGDAAGWLLTSPKPLITIRFDCFPLLEGTEYLAASLASTSDRVASMEVSGVPGEVPAIGRLVITDTGTQSRGHVEIGGDRYGYNSASPSDLDITAAELTALAGTLSGSYIGLTAASAPIAIAEKADLPHIGPHNVRAVVERTAAGPTIRVRAATRTADGQWSFTDWKTLPSGIGTYDLMLGDVTFAVVDRGTQVSTLRIEVTSTAAATVRLYRVNPIPTEVVYGVARQRTGGTPSSLDLYDVFEQTAGNLDAPKAANLGGNWGEDGRVGENGFQVETTGKTAQRTTPSDTAGSLGNGSFAFLGAAVAATVLQATVKFTALPTGVFYGLLARYTNTSNFLVLTISPTGNLALWKMVGGTPSLVKNSYGYFGALNFVHKLRLEVDANGTFRAYWQDVLIFSDTDVDLATGGTLASGKRGLFDYHPTASASTRNYDDFQAPSAAAVDYPLFSGRSCEIAHDHAIREGAAGTVWAPMPSYRGRRLFIPPAGPGGLKTRLVLKDRRTDVDGGVADSADTARSATLYVTPRYLVVP